MRKWAHHMECVGPTEVEVPQMLWTWCFYMKLLFYKQFIQLAPGWEKGLPAKSLSHRVHGHHSRL